MAATQHVHRPRGQTDRAIACAPIDTHLTKVPSVADLVPITQIMSREIACARPELGIDGLADLMVQQRIGCVPIVNERGAPIGMVTKQDLVEWLVALDRTNVDVVPQTARELMMPLALTLREHATVAHATAMMALEDIHHVVIIDGDGRVIGVVSSLDIVRWLAANDGLSGAR